MSKVTFNIVYMPYGGVEARTKTETWIKSDFYCPKCGKQTVWEEDTKFGGDYYEGENKVCTSCEALFTMPTLRSIKDIHAGNVRIQYLEALKMTITEKD